MTRSPLLDAAQHDVAQSLRAKYSTQLLALDQYLPDDQKTYDAGLTAARLVAAAAEYVANDTSFDASWLGRYLGDALAQARQQPASDGPRYDDLLTALGVDASLGMVLGSPLTGGPVTTSDLDGLVAGVS